MRRAAFFDVDRTLIPGSSLFLLARGLYERDFFRVRDLIKFGWGQLKFVAVGERAEDVDATRDSALAFVKGRYRDELRAWGREIAEERVLPRVYEDIARVIESHRNSGDETYLVTAAPVELASFLADSLQMTGALGTESEMDDQGRYTGRLSGEILHGPAKAKAVELLAMERDIDLSESSAYSDSKNDLPLLELVGNPHAVNPESELRRIARMRGWPVHELRTKRRALLIGVPSAVGGIAIFLAGMAAGAAVVKKRIEAGRRRWRR
ncbi:MAG TPA: HAD-IB family hydrolase [Actinomycetota bacterium]|nr:HAD-IB family hydrolase [Actinomycetota bacterium]